MSALVQAAMPSWLLSFFSEHAQEHVQPQPVLGAHAPAPAPGAPPPAAAAAAPGAGLGAGAETVQAAAQQRQAQFAAAAQRDQVSTVGVLSFAWSPYALALVLVALLVNRIHHVVPPARPRGLQQFGAGEGAGGAHQHAHDHGGSSALGLPLRIALRAPALALVYRAIAMISCALAACMGAASNSDGVWQLSQQWLVGSAKWVTCWAGTKWVRDSLPRLVTMAGEQGIEQQVLVVDDAKLMWHVFLAVCAAVVCETFVRALDDDLNAQTAFNLISFAFLLHMHAARGGTAAVLDGSRMSVYVHLLIVLGEILVLHLHFATSPPCRPLRFHISFAFALAGQAAVVTALVRRDMDALLWMGKAPELALEALAISTVVLRWLAAVLRPRLNPRSDHATPLDDEDARRRAFDADALLGPRESRVPDAHDDFAVYLVRLCASLLETSALSGLANEVAPIVIAPHLGARTRAGDNDLPTSKGSALARALNSQLALLPPDERDQVPYVAIARNGASEPALRHRRAGSADARVRSLGASTGEDRDEDEYTSEEDDGVAEMQRRRPTNPVVWGLAREIDAIDARGRVADPPSPLGRDPARVRAHVRLFKAIARIALLLALGVVHLTGNLVWRARVRFGLVKDEALMSQQWRSESGRAVRRRRRRAASPDFDYEERDEDEDETELSDEEEDEASDAELPLDEDEDVSRLWSEATAPLSELVQDVGTSSTTASTSGALVRARHPWTGDEEDSDRARAVMLAHQMLPRDEAPLTRSRFRRMLAPVLGGSSVVQTQAQALSAARMLDDAIESRREEVEQSRALGYNSAEDDERRRQHQRMCVVCCVEERNIVCWPCRCLTLCEDCREGLASRTPANAHLCPTCRSPVKGFSRIYIP